MTLGHDEPRGSVKTFNFSNYKMYDASKSKNSPQRYLSGLIFRGGLSLRREKEGSKSSETLLIVRPFEDSMGVNRGLKWKKGHQV